MRWGIIGAGALGCVLSLAMPYAWMATTNAGDMPDWRTRELLFLKSAHDRIQADLERQQPAGAGEASLRREQQALLQAMASIAKPMSADAIPDDVRPLLRSGDAPRGNLLAVAFESAAMEQPAELRIGLTTSFVAAPDLTGLSFDADLRAPLARRSAKSKPQADKPAGTKPAKPIKAAAATAR